MQLVSQMIGQDKVDSERWTGNDEQ
jgi:hypothetical protein